MSPVIPQAGKALESFPGRSPLDEISTAIADKKTGLLPEAPDKLSDVLFYLED